MGIAVRPRELLRRLEAGLSSIAGFYQALEAQASVKLRHEVEHMLMLSVAAEMVGVPVAPIKLQLALLPFLIPTVVQWRRRKDGLADLSGTMFPYLTNAEGLKLALLALEKDVAMLSCCAG